MTAAFKTVDPGEVSTGAFHQWMLGAVAPRPVAFASTVDEHGRVNLSPYSFFNAFGSNPPLLVFSPTRGVRDNTNKHTLDNARATGEVVINVVNYAMVEQTSLASCAYPRGVNEFEKAGFTPLPSVRVKPPRVAESPAAFECQVIQIIETGTEGGAGNLILCRVVMAHFQTAFLDDQGRIDPRKMDLVGRMGGDWYCRASGGALFEVPKPSTGLGIGVDRIPVEIRHSPVLTGNNLGRLGNAEALPDETSIRAFQSTPDIQSIREQFGNDPAAERHHRHRLAQRYLEAGQV
ncbi:MAG: flavin reductase family protein, partial [Ferruginibacter sp.]|nr:flavin reductase family protein [Cytophagales bacterium]